MKSCQACNASGREGDEMIESAENEWRGDPEWPVLYELIRDTVAGDSASHPGIITEAIVDAVSGRYEIRPRELHHRERRWNHQERIRRLSHAVFRILDAREVPVPTEKITAGVLKAFVLVPRRRPRGKRQ
jgi:hypothetical protein